MKRLFINLFILSAFYSPSFAADLWKMSLDDAAALGTTIQTDLMVKTEGQGSVRITTEHPTVVCIGVITGLDIEDARLVYKAKVMSDLKGAAYLELWAHVGPGQYFSKGLNDAIQGQSDWKTIQTPFIFKKGQRPKKVVLNLVINGQGTVWIDDVVLSSTSLK